MPRAMSNSDSFREQLDKAFVTSNGGKLAVMVVEVDRFHHYTTSLGADAGDELMFEVAARIRNVIGEDLVIARVRDRELGLLADNLASRDDAARIAADVALAMRTPINLHGRKLQLTLSVGVATRPDNGDDATTLLRNADRAMSYALDAGGNHVRMYSQELSQSARKQLNLEGEMQQALRQGELVVVYQPQLQFPERKVVGAEALLRWQHPEQGLLSPPAFLPTAERLGLLDEIGAQVVNICCRDAAAWRKRLRSDIRVCVNLAASQLRPSSLPRMVERALKESGLPPQLLELEVPERITMQDVEITVQTLSHLRQLGVSLALDNFGTGVSALSELKRFPLDRMKIDRAFTRFLPDDPQGKAIVKALVYIATALDLDLVGEGVESQAQVQALQSLGCRIMQGYHLCKPIPNEHFVAFVTATHGKA